ncbi:MAG: amino acid permease [Planctomycetes bacterium]|nr:amino acid permease [Planctomycetota bacterium]MCB9904368.1 amino acid permease [Planctomycetota bacterium]
MSDTRENAPGRFGTFGGVFTPCTLTILGVIMFLRFGQVVGNAGVWIAVGIVIFSKAITTLTALSLSAIATNTKVKGGGAYFMISRSLGAEYGGSIGVVFFLAQAVSVAMYIVGFTEAAISTFPALEEHGVWIATITNAVVFICVFIGAGWTIKVQYGILAVLLLALVSFTVGGFMHFDAELLQANMISGFSLGESPFTMFALFFPAATGIMAGANMSGDLRDPARAIPSGTLGAIGFTGLIYIGMAVLLGGVADRATLLDNNMIVRDTALWPVLVTAGIFAATLSSAIGSMMGAPRILQALARDRIFGTLTPFAVGSGAANEPRRAVVVTFLIAQGGIMVGDLDLIAPIITMFFMVTYGYLNLATFKESYTRNPSYRPTFRYTHWSMALLGTIACGGVMILMEPQWAMIAVVFMALLHWSISRRSVRTSWGNVHGGASFERARKELIRLEASDYHAKNWRPAILAFSGGAGTRVRMAAFGNWLCAGRGILSLAQVITGDVEDLVERRAGQERVLRKFIREQGFLAFPAVVVSADRHSGFEALVQCHGLGAFRPNTVLAGWSSDLDQAEDFIDTLRTAARLGQNVLLCSTADGEDPLRIPGGTIDVWWRGKDNGPLMVLLAHLLVQNPAWRDHTLRLLRVVANEDAEQETERHLRELLETARIRAEVDVIIDPDPIAAIHRTSENAAVTFLGFQLPPEDQDPADFLAHSEELLSELGTVFLVWSTGEVLLEA